MIKDGEECSGGGQASIKALGRNDHGWTEASMVGAWLGGSRVSVLSSVTLQPHAQLLM